MRLIYLILSCIIFSMGYAQTIIDIEIDEISLSSDNIKFLNHGEEETYVCEMHIVQYRDFDYDLIQSCYADMYPEYGKRTMEWNEIKKFSKPERLNNWLSDKKYRRKGQRHNENYTSHLQYLDSNFFVHFNLEFDNYSKKWRAKNAYFLDYVYLRINGKYLIVCLIDNDGPREYVDPRIRGFIIPNKNGDVILFKGSRYVEAGRSADSLGLVKSFPSKDFFRIKDENGKKWLYDKLFQERIIDQPFNEIFFGRRHIICDDDDGSVVFDNSAQKRIIKNAQIAHDFKGLVQFIKSNKIYWLDKDGIMYDTFPKPAWAWCGTISSTQRIIDKTEEGFFESYETGYWGARTCRDSIHLVNYDPIQSIQYLNNATYNEFDEYSDIYAVFRFPYNYYIINEENKKRLVAISNKRDSLERELILERDWGIGVNKNIDSLNNLIEELKDEIRVDLKFDGDFESFGYNHPIKFQENGLFGYYPQNPKARYKKLGKFNFHFAEFEMIDGRKGWLDNFGKEHFR